jgi:hypothetical protein
MCEAYGGRTKHIVMNLLISVHRSFNFSDRAGEEVEAPTIKLERLPDFFASFFLKKKIGSSVSFKKE